MEKPRSKIQTRYRYRNRDDPVGEELEEKVKMKMEEWLTVSRTNIWLR